MNIIEYSAAKFFSLHLEMENFGGGVVGRISLEYLVLRQKINSLLERDNKQRKY